MARWMTPFRMGGIAVVAGLLLGLALGQSTRMREPSASGFARAPEARAARATGRHARTATWLWRTASAVDSLRRQSLQAGRVAMSRGVPEPFRSRLPSVRARGIPDSAIRIAVIIDTTFGGDQINYDYRRPVRLTVALPRRNTEPCLVLIRLGDAAFDNTYRLGDFAGTISDALPGPCAFAYRFGPPGRGMAEWLQGTNATFARHYDEGGPLPREATDRTTLLDFRWNLDSRDGREFLACLRGSPSACTNWATARRGDVLSTVPTDRHVEQALAAVGVTASLAVATARGSWSYQPFSDRMLADLVAMEGADRFQTFWTSDAPLEEAFQSAYGRPLGAWIVDWMAVAGPPMPREFLPAGRAIPGGLLLVAVALGGALAYVSRRTVSA